MDHAKHPFQIGDRVICERADDGNTRIVGVTGTVCGPLREGWCGVEYDKPIGGHDCLGKCEAPYGWDTAYDCLTLYQGSEQPVAEPVPYEVLNI